MQQPPLVVNFAKVLKIKLSNIQNTGKFSLMSKKNSRRLFNKNVGYI